MPIPHLTFGCELDSEALRALFADSHVVADLQTLSASVSLGLLDLSGERAEVVRQLNAAGVPVTAWLLLPQSQGYWFNLDNAPQALAFYDQFLSWTAAQKLQWDGVGLDIEPDIQILGRVAAGDIGALPGILRRALDGARFRRGRLFYHRLAERIRADGHRLESYQFPFIVDERRAGSTLLQRLLGVVDLDVDREVLMLYTSFMRPEKFGPAGPGMLWSYGPEAQGIAVGSTGGGVTVGGVDQIPPLTWDEFSRDLLLAHHWCDHVFVFSLEGAVRQGYLTRLRDLDWSQRLPAPWRYYREAERFRQVLRAGLWCSAHPWVIVAGLFFALKTARALNRPGKSHR
ncbi:MAG: hypothetical protein JXA21_27385 [Anaerolineae bacterium]|nr:hypothetical protein [Anaerolineae bacterium]